MQLRKIVTSLYNSALDIIAPPHCVQCKQFLDEHSVFCSECIKYIMPVVSTTIPLTKTRSMKVMAIGAYQDPLKSLILAKGRAHIAASYQLGQLIWEKTYICNMPCDALVPIPLHWTRFAWRGYNQAEEIAKSIAQQGGGSVHTILRRHSRTAYQSQLSQEQRQKNVRNVFTLQVQDAAVYNNKHIILVDDLMTTGATLREAAKQISRLKPASITAVVACRVV